MPDARSTSSEVDIELIRSGIRLMALRALGDADAAEEVAQEALSRAVAVIRNPGGTANLGAYVAGIARHVIADFFRARDRTAPMTVEAFEAVHDESADALDALCSEEENERVRSALGALAPADRELITLCYFHSLSPSEVARRLGVPAERIRQRKLRALQRLRTAYDSAVPARHAPVTSPTDVTGITETEAHGSAA